MAAERKTGARNSMQVVGTFSSHPCHVARLRPLFADDQSAAVKLNQIGTMAYADYRASRQTFLQHAIQIAFGGFVERRTCLVHEQPVRVVQHGTRKCDALLLTSRKQLRQC